MRSDATTSDAGVNVGEVMDDLMDNEQTRPHQQQQLMQQQEEQPLSEVEDVAAALQSEDALLDVLGLNASAELAAEMLWSAAYSQEEQVGELGSRFM